MRGFIRIRIPATISIYVFRSGLNLAETQTVLRRGGFRARDYSVYRLSTGDGDEVRSIFRAAFEAATGDFRFGAFRPFKRTICTIRAKRL